MKNNIHDIFTDRFGSSDRIRSFFSPGRVNLIGEHTDYNGGYVFPCAIDKGTYGSFALRDDQTIRLFSENFPEKGIIELNVDQLDYRSEHGWANYVKGVIKEFIKRGFLIQQGFDLAIYGNLPDGAGLSSSASLELLVATILNEVYFFDVSRTDLALLCQKVENDYMHVNCGIMDQYVIANAKKDHAILLNTAKLDATQVNIDLPDHDIVIVNSKIKRGLIESQYNERRKECEKALKVFQKALSIKHLCDLSLDQFTKNAHLIEDEDVLKRARHVITEHYRTIDAHYQLVNDNLEGFAHSITMSHDSLRDDFEVSTDELDFLVSSAMKHGSLGSRMTGAGFGGSTVNIVPKDKLDRFREHVTDDYKNETGIIPDIFVIHPEAGTHEIK